MKRLGLVLGFLLTVLVACTATLVITTVTITEPTGPVSLNVGQSQTFKATVSSSSGSIISWSDDAAGGSFTPTSGPEVVYTAPAVAGSYTVTASINAGASKDSRLVTVLDPLPVDETFALVGNGDPNTPLRAAVTLAAGTSRVYRINTPALSAQALIVELSQPLALSVFNADPQRSLFASSASAEFFAKGDKGLSSALNAQGISINTFCRGSCVYQNAASVATVFAKVENKSASPVSFDLFAYSEAYSDTGEPANNTVVTAPELKDADSGALEVLDDVDYYRVGKAGTLRFVSSNEVVSPRAQILSANNDLIATLEPNQIQVVSVGMVVKVFASTERAAAASVSRYILTIE